MIIDGKKIAQDLRSRIKLEVKTLGRKPGLAVVLVGEDPASKVYINFKEKACVEVGFYSKKIILPIDTKEAELLKIIDELNNNNKIDGILVQLPLPDQIDKNKVIETISPEKDVDGFHSENAGKLAQNRGVLRACTPKGVITMLESIGCDLAGKDCIMIGASNIVGRPMALELLNKDATVTICNSKTTNLSGKIKSADVIIVGVGVPHLVKGKWIPKGSIVIDIGINRLENGKLVGDVEFDEAKNRAAFISPVPGGVGPMTIATLLENTLIAYKNRI